MSRSILGLCAALLFCSQEVRATYSIIACEAKTQQCGVAVQTNNLAVGASVPYAQAGVGAIASQFETNPAHGPRGLALMKDGRSPEQALRQLLDEDGQFEGQGSEARQVALVSIDGRTAVHTGEEALHSPWAGSRSGKGYSIQGNGLAGAEVVEAMERGFLDTRGPLAERLMAALIAGDRAGGQSSGRESAALLVKTPDGWPIDIDLRVDHSADPVADLRRLLDQQSARAQVARAQSMARKGHPVEAKVLLIGAVALAPTWPRVWIRAARVALDIGQYDLALQYLNVAFAQNPAWVQTEIGQGSFAALGAEPLFHRWIDAGQQERVANDYQQVSANRLASTQDRISIARRLLEVGRPQDARAAVARLKTSTSAEAAELQALNATLERTERHGSAESAPKP
jgi:uncharacterized Ntn-hydrolase superfamily protein